MFKLIGTLIKTTLFAVAILLLGNWVRWDGKSLSEHVRIQTAKIEESNAMKSTQEWAEKISKDARQGYLREIPNPFAGKQASAPAAQPGAHMPNQTVSGQTQVSPPPQEKIPASERQKLRALIEELNTSSSAPTRR